MYNDELQETIEKNVSAHPKHTRWVKDMYARFISVQESISEEEAKKRVKQALN